MPIQTVYNTNIDKARVGAVANMEAINLISGVVQNAAGIAFGAVVARDSAGDNCVHTWVSGTDKYLGICVRERSINPANAADKFAQYDDARIMTKGVIWVLASVVVAAGDPVYVTPAGVITNVTTSNFLLPNAVFDSATTAINQLARVRLS